MQKEIRKETSTVTLIVVAFVLLLVGGLLVTTVKNLFISYFGPPSFVPSAPPTTTPPEGPEAPAVVTPEFKEIKKFSSEQEFKDYLEEGEALMAGIFGVGGFGMGRGIGLVDFEGMAIAMPTEAPSAKGTEPERVSETTVQVAGIDEPDIVKTNGKEIYFSSQRGYYPIGLLEEVSILPPGKAGETKVIKAFPPADLSPIGKIDKTGDLLLKDNILAVFSGQKIYGYNISDPKAPEREWTINLEGNNQLAAARLYNDKIYLVVRTRVSSSRPCPIEILSDSEAPLREPMIVRCTDIYHPAIYVPVDVAYTALMIEVDSGEVVKKISFVGSADSSVVYMSENALYATYSYYGDFIKFMYNFYSQKCEDIIPETVRAKLAKLMGYDISSAAKYTEFGVIMEDFYNGLDNDERMRVENELSNRMDDYYGEHSRELEKTGIVKIGLANFEVASTGEVPGKPLNQFSLDEYQTHLRVAVTIGSNRWGLFWELGESANDVYVLGSDLKVKGSVKDLGLGERIYSARFIGDKGYLVTFKQIDPFFVLDLSDPTKPQVKGELKIPGYSSYLHPITNDKILGIGKEGSRVKISLFDVQNPAEPTEASKYTLDEYWSDILNTHHAFLLDTKHNVFFLPGSKGGYIFSYEGDELKLKKAVSGISARRALYINDYLYIISDTEITVLNELDWTEVNKLEL